MKDELKYNLTNYLISNNKREKVITILIIFILLILLLISVILKIEDIEVFHAITTCEEKNCVLKFYRKLVKYVIYDINKIKEKKYKIKKIEFAEPGLDKENSILQEVTLNLKQYQGINNEIVEIKLYKNKEKLIKKIIRIIVER